MVETSVYQRANVYPSPNNSKKMFFFSIYSIFVFLLAQLGGWMNIPGNQLIPNCPPGLEYLTTIDQLLVKQKVELLEAFTGFETNNKFTIKNSLGQKVCDFNFSL